jgi:exopolyphosphatase/guanosine-5'-triphosphate,3'-diphosphate pyrophosphatase
VKGGQRVSLLNVGDAAFRAELAAAVEDAGAEPLWVLSPDEEARFSFVGATRTLPEPPAGAVAVADVGGGSTEVAIGEPDGGVSWSRSWNVGSGSLTEAHVRSDPPSADELAQVRAEAHRVLGSLGAPRAGTALAVGGTAASMHRLAGPVLSQEALTRALEVLRGSEVAEIAARFELDPERVRLLPAGILVLTCLSERLGLPLEIARGGLREGVLLELLEGPEAAA